MIRLAILSSHPIQYYAPWFAQLAAQQHIQLRVFYLWNPQSTGFHDHAFTREVIWDIPLLEGYDYTFVPNVSRDPGTHHFFGLKNPSLLQEVESFNPDLVLCYGYRYESLMRFLFRWNRSRAPLLFRGDSHRLDPRSSPLEPLRRGAISTVFRRFSGFLYVGRANERYFRYHGVPEERLFFAPHAVDNSRFMVPFEQKSALGAEWRQTLGVAPDTTLLLYVGKLEEKKNPLALLRAFMAASPAGTVLAFVGSGPLEQQAKQLAGTHPAVRFTSFVNQASLPALYAAGDALVLPSIYGETWGLVVNEAMCAGNGLILSDRVGCAEDLLEPRGNGVRVPADDEHALKEALLAASADRNELARWGRRSQEIIRSYNFEAVTRGFFAAAEHCLQSGSPKLQETA